MVYSALGTYTRTYGDISWIFMEIISSADASRHAPFSMFMKTKSYPPIRWMRWELQLYAMLIMFLLTHHLFCYV